VAERKPFLLRVDPALLDELQRWADQDLRSINGQIEFLLRRALSERKRSKDQRADRARTGDANAESSGM
jgi:hypothetical protein